MSGKKKGGRGGLDNPRATPATHALNQMVIRSSAQEGISRAQKMAGEQVRSPFQTGVWHTERRRGR